MMKPIPSAISKTYQQRGPLQQYRLAEATAFRCFRCGSSKKSKLITVYTDDWSKKLCNGCYGRLLSLYEIKAGTAPDDLRSEKLSEILSSLVTVEQQKEAERLFRASEERANTLSSGALRFIATSEHIATQLGSDAQLEWSPAVIGLCKAVEIETVNRILKPLASLSSGEDLNVDKRDKDIGRVAAYCIDSERKSPELGVFSHFLQTVIHSKQRRQSSQLVKCFLHLVGQWTDSTWLLEPKGLHLALTELTKNYRNRAAHIDELSKDDYFGCRETVIGNKGIVWKLILSTERHK